MRKPTSQVRPRREKVATLRRVCRFRRLVFFACVPCGRRLKMTRRMPTKAQKLSTRMIPIGTKAAMRKSSLRRRQLKIRTNKSRHRTEVSRSPNFWKATNLAEE